MSLREIILKDLAYLRNFVLNLLRNGLTNKTILVYPHYPSHGSSVYRICNYLNYNITNKLNCHTEIAVCWEYETVRQSLKEFEELDEKKKTVNLLCNDISKLVVDKVHNIVFGYSTVVNPLNYNGLIVKKSDLNGKHDGEILKAPITKVENGFIYQVLIDNCCEKSMVKDIRVPIINGLLDFVYIKYRAESERFNNTSEKVVIKNIDSVFSREERGLISQFCREMNLDFGELDVLRDNKDGRIYVVDVNCTPQSPPSNIKSEDAEIAIKKMSENFKSFL